MNGRSSDQPVRSAAAEKLRLLRRLRCTWRQERALWAAGFSRVAGVDEAGRGALCGPVVAAAVILDPRRPIRGLRDSKLLPRKRREELDDRIRGSALAFAVSQVDAARIDQINIYQASRVAMLLAVEALSPSPDHLLLDAMRVDYDAPQISLIHGDSRCASIAAASILAKVERDRLLCQLDALYPAYGLAAHKGYGTPQHLDALRLIGPSPIHRQSFAPVWNCSHPQETLPFALDLSDDEPELLEAGAPVES
ncbi:MAG: ribonuclease HII [Terriglobales bacterium]